jgi:adenine deaminase
MEADGRGRGAVPGPEEEAAEERARLLAVARGEQAGDVAFTGGTLVNVYSGELLPANVVTLGERIAYVGAREPRLGPATRHVDCRGLCLAPAWFEPHGHHWLLYNPAGLAEAIVPGGTTTLVGENLFLHLAAGASGTARCIRAVADAGLPLRHLWLIRVMAQSGWEGEGRAFAPEAVLPLLELPEVLGVAEITRWPQVWRGEPGVLRAAGRARALGKRVDGHTAGASHEKLNAVAAAGVTACHEAITAQEVADRLRLGLWTMLRHSSLRPDLPELVRAITETGLDTERLMLTADGPNPGWIGENGYLDAMLRLLVRSGVPPVQAIRMATLHPATYYGLDGELGGVAPGRLADLVLLPDLESFRPESVWSRGREVARRGRLVAPVAPIDWGSLGLSLPFAAPAAFADARLYRPRAPGEVLPAVEAASNAITRGGGYLPWDGESPPAGALLAVLADRGGGWATRAWLRGFAAGLEGVATTANATTHLLVLGRDAGSMAAAAARVAEMGGGFAAASGGRVEWSLPLPVAGLMVAGGFDEARAGYAALEARMRAAGLTFADALYAFLFLTCDFLPAWRLTARGVLDVRSGDLVAPPWEFGRSGSGGGPHAAAARGTAGEAGA